jgi:Transglycosylase SLT domain
LPTESTGTKLGWGDKPVRILAASAALVLCGIVLVASPARTEQAAADEPVIALPPAITALIGLPQPISGGRRVHLLAVRQEAEQQGLPPEVADAVVQVESAYNPHAVGGVGEVGLMQVRPETAAMLGHRGGLTELFEPATNIRYGVMYLARAWQLADGDLCRALMKYRAGHGEERMTPLSVEYCRRARGHLAAIGSPLGAGALPIAPASGGTFSTAARQRAIARLAASGAAAGAGAVPVPPPRDQGKVRLAALGDVKISEEKAREMARAQARRVQSRKLWAAHEERMRAITSKVKPADLRIAAGG